jgi:hypothetical protein
MKMSDPGGTHGLHPICLGVAVYVRRGCLVTREQEGIGNHHILIPASREYYDLRNVVRCERYATSITVIYL